MASHSLEHEAESISNYAEGDIPETEPEGFSRDLGDYSPTNHFLCRLSDGYGPASETRVNPPITSEVIGTCIREGELRPGHSGRWLLEAEVGGYEWRLVVSIDGDRRLVQSDLVSGVHSPDDHDPSRRFGGDRR